MYTGFTPFNIRGFSPSTPDTVRCTIMVRNNGTMLIEPMSPGPLIDIFSVNCYFPDKITVPWNSDFAATGVFAASLPCTER